SGAGPAPETAGSGAGDDPTAESSAEEKQPRRVYRRLLWHGDRLTGAIILGMSHDLWTTNDVGMLKGLVQSGAAVGAWKEALRHNPWGSKRPFIAAGEGGRRAPGQGAGGPPVPAAPGGRARKARREGG